MRRVGYADEGHTGSCVVAGAPAFRPAAGRVHGRRLLGAGGFRQSVVTRKSIAVATTYRGLEKRFRWVSVDASITTMSDAQVRTAVALYLNGEMTEAEAARYADISRAELRQFVRTSGSVVPAPASPADVDGADPDARS